MAEFKTLKIFNKNRGWISFLFSPSDEDIIMSEKWHYSVTSTKKTYIRNSKNILLHRILLNAQEGDVVDHINGDTLDNRRENLRITTTSGNNKNRKGYSKTGWKFFTYFDRKKHSRSYCVYFPKTRKKYFVIRKEAEAHYLECLMAMEGRLTW